MNLDKLKELEHRLTGLKLVDIKYDCGHGKLFFVYDDNRTVYLTDMDVADTCALRNQAKEMIETIERYKGALEDGKKILHGCSGSQMEEAIVGVHNILDMALKDPEKDSQPNGEDQQTD